VSGAPAVSVLVPAFNDERHLAAALASLAAQSAGDFEAIVSDDGSSDRTPEVAQAWVEKDRRFRLQRNPCNLGMTENWNAALAAARGQFVAKLDADDVWAPELLAQLRRALDEDRESVAAFCRTVVCDERLAPLGPWLGDQGLRRAGFDPEREQRERGRRFWLASFDDVQLWHSCAFLVRRETLLALGGWDERWSCASDTALLLRLLGRDRPVRHLPLPGVLYRQRPGSVSGTFAARGWKVLENALVHLDALDRDAARLRPWPRSLRQNWWRHWKNAAAWGEDGELWAGMPEPLRAKLSQAYRARSAPPRWVRCTGWARQLGWRAKQGWRAERRRPAEGHEPVA